MEYQGWTNRQTWAASLWINNNQELYAWVQNEAKTLTLDEAGMSRLSTYLRVVFEWVKQVGLVDSRYSDMLNDIGDIRRVDFAQVAANILNDVNEVAS